MPDLVHCTKCYLGLSYTSFDVRLCSPCVINNTSQIGKLCHFFNYFIVYIERLFVCQGNLHLLSLFYINF